MKDLLIKAPKGGQPRPNLAMTVEEVRLRHPLLDRLQRLEPLEQLGCIRRRAQINIKMLC
jgi:hypothetical protein